MRADYDNLHGSIAYWKNIAQEIDRIMDLYMDNKDKWFEESHFRLKVEDE